MSGTWSHGKGDRYRPVDGKKYGQNYDNIFRKATMKTLFFLNPVFKDGENLTVRRGVKWATLVVPGESVQIVRTPDPKGVDYGDKVVFGKVTRVVLKRMCDTVHKELRLEHDPACHTQAGLLRAMRKAYPDFSPEEICTLLFFEVVE